MLFAPKGAQAHATDNSGCFEQVKRSGMGDSHGGIIV
jgi:hypothetical protein